MKHKPGLLIENLQYPGRLLNLLRIKRKRQKELDRPGYLPAVMDIEPNVKCNLSCRMCQVATWDRMVHDLTVDRFRMILDQIPSLMKIKLQGMGEPFLNGELLEMARVASDSGIKVVTNSNGTLLGPDLASRLVSGPFDIVSISVDGATPETYESIRIGAEFEKVIENIRGLITARGEGSDPEIEIWMVGMKENIRELPNMVRLCSSLGVDRFNLQHDVNFWGKQEWAERLSGSSLGEDDPEINGIISESRGLAAELGLSFNIFTADRYSRKSEIKCRWPWESAYITAEGYVCPCCITCDPEVVNFGNVFEEGFSDIWRSDEYVKFRKQIREGDLPAFCEACYID